jgi:RNA 2',3'-cyclic 3'-phosphodiesterase
MADTERFRLFVALILPEEVKARIAEAQAELRRALPGHNIRWTRREQFHLTLRFLGDVEAARVEALGEALRRACQGFPPLRLRAEGLGCFPDLRYPRVLWTGVAEEAGQLARLQEAVEVASRDFTTEKKEERFTGHVTLARIKGIKRSEAEALAQAAVSMKDRRFGEWTACKIELMRSELSPQGARHTPVAALDLSHLPEDLA